MLLICYVLIPKKDDKDLTQMLLLYLLSALY